MLTYLRHRSRVDQSNLLNDAAFVQAFHVSGRWRGAFVKIAEDEIVFRRPKQPPLMDMISDQEKVELDTTSGGMLSGVEAPQQVLARLNTRINNSATAPIALRAAVLLAVLGVLIHPAVAATLLAIGLSVSGCAALVDGREKSFPLIYDLDEASLKRWRILEGALRTIMRSSQIWWLPRQDVWWDHQEFDLHKTKPTVIRLKRAKPPHLATNIRPLSLKTSESELYFFPDRLYVYRNGQYRTHSYAGLDVQLGTTIFRDLPKAPEDAVCLRTHAEGEAPPKRFGFRISEGRVAVTFARLDFRTADGGCAASIHLSSQAVGREARGLLNAAMSGFRRLEQDARRAEPAQSVPKRRGAPPDSYVVLGLAPGCARDAATLRYRDLAKEYHPDVVFHLEIRERLIAEEKMKKINQAWEEVKIYEGWSG
jgi:hypothetical protein